MSVSNGSVFQHVFDGSTDFAAVSTLEEAGGNSKTPVPSSSAACHLSPYVAFQLEDMDLKGKQVIPYQASEIKVEKCAGKKTASAFCSFNSRRPKMPPPPPPIAAKEEYHDSSARSTPLHLSESDDAVSVVSDMSELSVMSLSNHHFVGKTSIPEVHGGKRVNGTRHRLASKDFSSITSDHCQSQVNHREELLKMKSGQFELQRENANLKSQLEAAQELCKSLEQERTNTKEFIHGGDQNKYLAEEKSSYEFKAQLRKAHDEIFRLKTELTKAKLDLRSKADEAERGLQRYAALETSSAEFGSVNQRLQIRVRELEGQLEATLRTKVTSEQSLQVLQSERDSFVKSRDWYRDQLHSAQEARTGLQKQAMAVQKEVALKANLVEQLKLELSHNKKILEHERELALKEKEGLKRQLEDLEVDLDNKGPQDFEKVTVENQGCTVEELEADLALAHEELGEKSALVETLEVKLEDAADEHELLLRKSQDSTLTLSALKTQVDESKSTLVHLNEELRSKTCLIEQLQEIKMSDELVISRLRSDSDKLKSQLKCDTDLMADIQKLKGDLEQREIKLEQVQEDCRRHQCELLRARRELDNLKPVHQESLELKKKLLATEFIQQDNHDLRKSLVHYKDLYSSLESKFAKNEEQLAIALSGLDIANNKVAELEQLLDERSKAYEAITRQLADKTSQLQDLSVDLQGEIVQTSRELESVRQVSQEKLELIEYDSQLKQLLEANEDLTTSLQASQDLNKSLASEVEKSQLIERDASDAKANMEQLKVLLDQHIQENHELSRQLVDQSRQLPELEEDKEAQSQKIVRLECSLAVCEAEIAHLSSTIGDLEDQILGLEQTNGRLVMEGLQNGALKRQIGQLQEDIAKDTELRRQLLHSVELAKSSLNSEVVSLDRCLAEEKEKHAEAKERLLIKEHECSKLRVELKSFKTGLDTANMAIERLKKDSSISTKKHGDVHNGGGHEALALKTAELGQVRSAMEEAKMKVASLEDQVEDLNLTLEQKTAEVAGLNLVVRMKDEAYESEMAEVRVKCDNLRLEIVRLTRKVDELSDEKNSYRSQVQDMNVALKNSLEHIKRLRSKAEPLHEEPNWDELLQKSEKGSSRNLTSLQNCLASLKSEMAVLQKKLAPSSSPASSRSSSAPQSPEKSKKERD